MPEREQHEDHHRARSLWLWSVAWSVGLLLLMQPGPTTGQTDAEIETVFWESVECESTGQVELYLEIYPTGRYVAEAHECLEGQLGLERAARILVQQGLTALNYSVGAADGLFGPATRAAVRAVAGGKGICGDGVSDAGAGGHVDGAGAGGSGSAAAGRSGQAQEAERAGSQGRAATTAEAARRPAEAGQKRSQPGETFRDCPTCPQMVVVPAGSYQMGSPSYEAGRDDDEGPVHRVTIGQPLAVGSTK